MRQDRAKAQALILMTEANKKLKRGFYLEALELFRKAHALYPSPKLHFNIAQTYMELGRHLKALFHYEQFVRKIRKEEAGRMMWNLAHARIFQLMGKIATVQLVTNVADAHVSTDGQPAGTTPLSRPLRLLPGAHVLVISKPGYEKKVLELKLRPGQSVTRMIRLLRPEQAAATRRIVLKIQAEKKRIEQQKKEIQRRLELERSHGAEKEAKRRRILQATGISALSAGAAAAIMGAVFGILFKAEADKVEKAGTERYWEDIKKHYDRGNDYKKAMIISLGIGGAVAAAGGALIFVRYRTREAPPVTPTREPAAPKPAVSALPVFGPDRFGLTLKVDF